MGNNSKKIFGIAMAVAMLGSTAALAACGAESVEYKGDALSGYVSAAEVASNGGFAVQKGDYVYFINGMENASSDNTYGDVVKGSLMRISASALASGDADRKAESVVPSLFTMKDASGKYTTGVYIYGDYVYYATPTTDKTMGGEVNSSYVDFKRAKIDGSEGPMSDYYFRLSTGNVNYRFVTVDGVDENGDGKEDVFCLYESDSALKSFNTATRKEVTLVKGAKSNKFYYDMKDLENPNVYYTMAVNYDADTTAPYDQLYCVNAAAKATVNAAKDGKVSYTVKDGKTYTFEESAEKEIAESKSAEFKAEDYATYSYVNLGTLVLDGIGKHSTQFTQYNNAAEKDTARESLEGFTYTVQRYENGGVYFTRTDTLSPDSKLYYLADEKENWDTVSGNKAENLDIVAFDTVNASSTALFEIHNGVHTYVYLSGNAIYRATPNANGAATPEQIAYNVSGTLLKTVGDYVYYYSDGTNGSSLSRVNYKGQASHYGPLLVEMLPEYRPVKVAYIDYDTSWYAPEFIGDTVLYLNAQSYGGSTAYNYVYAAKLGTTEEIKGNNEAYEAVSEYVEEYSSDAVAQAYIQYYFRTDGKLTDEVKALYNEKYAKDNDGKNLLDYVAEKFAENGELKKETEFLSLVGRFNSTDEENIANDWANSLLKVETTEEEEGLSGLEIALIIIGSVLVVAGITVAVVLIVKAQKKKEADKREAEETVNAYKRAQIDTTDDKSIDVYADEQPAEETERTEVEKAAEESAEESEENAENAEEVAAESAEETPAEENSEEVSAENVEEKE